ncbi:uncharacterized protein [Epargyreus clarus]|uniref:uncharacterized protein n=1 Tax=Epargyreus clarus TaxID=520877 RepID=UPI003C2B0F6B
MNKKNKNKNRKPANPVPAPQKVDAPIIEAATVLEEKPVESVKESDSVVETVSEVTSPITEENDTASDSPKKPKRNKGKKKKEDPNEEIKLTPVEPPAPELPETREVKDEGKEEIKEPVVEEENKVEENITPNVRKKKNKKKQNEQQKVEEPPKEIIVEKLEDVKKEENIMDTSIASDSNKPEIKEPETKSKKKNKKKKHRHDSEKSDKAEEISCTAAFQKLISSTDNEDVVKSTEDIEPPKDMVEKNKQDISPKEETLKELIESVLLPEEIQEPEKESKDEPKSKKKHKKDKKQHKEDIESKNVVEVASHEIPVESTTETIPQDIVKDDVIQGEKLPLIENLESETVDPTDKSKTEITQPESKPMDTTAKPKAKIAKPVDKKRKGKQEPCESHDKADDHITTEIVKVIEPIVEEKLPALDENITVEADKVIEHLPEKLFEEELAEQGKVSEKEAVESKSNILEDISTQKLDETIIADVEHKLITDIVFETPPDFTTLTDIITPPVEVPAEATDNTLEITEKPIDDKIKSTEEPVDNKTIKEIIQPDIIKTTEALPQQFDVAPETSVPIAITEERDKDISVSPEPYKTVEKKKKKHHKKIDITNVPAEKTPEHKVLVTPDFEQVKEEPPKQSEDIFDLPSPGDVEISSLKIDDTEGSSEVTPDFIHHPLATSQQFIDDNNNMLIREITSTDDKLPPPLFFPTFQPIIRGSGETPEPVFERVIEPPIMRRERSNTGEPEKTDLKSKMMEVNKDMEELRLSIERSLAELTSMEKTEQEVEKQLEAETPKLDIVTEPAVSSEKDIKQSEDNKIDIVAKSTTEKEKQPEEVKIESENIFSENINITEEINKPQDLTEDIVLKIEEPIPEKIEIVETEKSEPPITVKPDEEKKIADVKEAPPVAPARKDHKGKGKGKRKGKQDAQSHQTTSAAVSTTSTAASETTTQEAKKEEKSEQKQETSQSDKNKGKQQSMQLDNGCNGSEEIPQDSSSNTIDTSFEPIENFEDALTSSVDDVNKTFEMIANEVNISDYTFQNPEINIIAPEETDTKSKENPVSPPKNLLGHPDIPVPSNRPDYKKEKNKQPNMRQAKVKIKDAVDIEKDTTKQSKESQTENKRKLSKNMLESFSYMTNGDSEYVYKYSFRKVFLQSLCHVCRKELSQRVPCQFCSLVFYCSQKHKDEDWPQHQSLCFAVCTIVHLKEQKHIFADAKNTTGHNYRLLRMQMIVSCEKVLKRKLVPWEQEIFLYPRICADVGCREWRQSKLADCGGCGQISYCSDHPDHLPASHQRWCRSYALYQKLVHHQQTKGRLEPKMPTRIMAEGYRISDKINEVLAAMYDEKIDMTDTEYAALTQLATAPLTAAYCHQQATMAHANGMSKKTSFVIHVVGAELQFEADVLYKWEVFFLHLKPDVKELRIVLISPDLNPSKLPLDLLGKINLCESCRTDKRRVLFSFQDKKTYYEYWSSDDFFPPDIVCAFNPSIQRSSIYNGKDTWPTTISCILKLKTPFIISSYSLNELYRDMRRIKECSDLSGVTFKTIIDPKSNPFASVRPDRNFITDEEIPLLFKNYCFAVLCGI